MNLSKKIIIVSICFVTIVFIFLGFLFLERINIYEKCLIVKQNNYHLLITNKKPYYNTKTKQYILNIHQNNHVDNYYLDGEQVIKESINNQNIYLCQINCLKEYYLINEPIFLKIKQTSIFNVFFKKN